MRSRQHVAAPARFARSRASSSCGGRFPVAGQNRTNRTHCCTTLSAQQCLDQRKPLLQRDFRSEKNLRFFRGGTYRWVRECFWPSASRGHPHPRGSRETVVARRVGGRHGCLWWPVTEGTTEVAHHVPRPRGLGVPRGRERPWSCGPHPPRLTCRNTVPVRAEVIRRSIPGMRCSPEHLNRHGHGAGSRVDQSGTCGRGRTGCL
jgi:hypothetical protein